MKAFMSYSRSDASLATALADDIRQMGHTLWYDREVTGGQAWWNAILGQIRECDLFIFILTPASMESQACRSEYTYASRLQKRILPVLYHDGVKVNLLPLELSVIQFVDYRVQSKQSAFALARALQHMPEAVPPPDPLPPEPPVPISYLGDLRTQIETNLELTSARQRDLLFEVKRRLKDPESHDGALDLLRLLRDREDLFASVAEEIDAVLNRSPQERKAALGAPRASVAEVAAASPAPTTVDLIADGKGLKALVRNVALNSESWVLRAGEDSLCIYLENDELVLATPFPRWTEMDAQRLRDMGWTVGGKGVQAVALVAVGVFAAATYGLGLGLLMHKKTRDYLNRNLAIKKFPLSQESEAAASIVELFGVLCPDVPSAVVLRPKRRPLKEGKRS